MQEFQIPYLLLQQLVLSQNQVHGLLPKLSPSVYVVDLSKNSFSGSISPFLCQNHSNWDQVSLGFLYLQEIFFSGNIPECWANWQHLMTIHLGNNNLTGNIPISLGHLGWLETLHLRNNWLSGGIPSSLLNCSRLKILDLGKNKFVGRIPRWLGRFPVLLFLGLHSNKFHSNIPNELCHLNYLQILDLAHNSLSGPIPRCFGNFSAMTYILDPINPLYFIHTEQRADLPDNAQLVTKGRELEYSRTLNIVTSMDLSDNNLCEQIPGELMSLHVLESLNLSGKHLTGWIPREIGDLRSLESIDFSRNQLSGRIPASVSSLTFLSYLNLSYNDLTGKIPSGTQIQSFNASSFIGNKLCGPPLENNCSNVNNSTMPISEGFIIDFPWFYVSMALGFVVGFWAVMGPVLFKRSWRFACFRFLDNFAYKFVRCG